VAARNLSPYFDADGQQRALDAYAKFAFAPERGWSIENKVELYDASRRAFDPAVPQGEALSAFRKIYDYVTALLPKGVVMSATDKRAPSPIALGQEEGEALWFLGFLATIKASAEATEGRVAVTEHLAPQGAGSYVVRSLSLLNLRF
jgi:hypothetical protein